MSLSPYIDLSTADDKQVLSVLMTDNRMNEETAVAFLELLRDLQRVKRRVKPNE